MVAKSAFSVVGLAHKVCLVAEGQGYTPELLNALAERPELFGQLLQLQLGQAEVRIVDHVVDCDLDPKIPDDWTIEEHQKDGKVKLERRGDALFVDGVEIELFLDDTQKEGTIVGTKLREKLTGKPVLNVCILDYLLEHPHLIPESWKKDEQGRLRYVFFWGTIFRYSGRQLSVRCLYWHVGRWFWSFNWLDLDFGDQFPAAVRAS